MQVRRATAADIPAIVALFKRHHEEQAFAFPFDPAQVSLDLSALLRDPDWLCLVADRSALVAHAYRPPFTPVRVAVEVMLRCERSGFGRMMRTELERWAREQGCWIAALGTTHSAAAFARLYRPEGYRPAETTFSKVL